MSAVPARYRSAAARQAVPTPARGAAAPQLRLVSAPAISRTRAPFVIFCSAILGAALLGALLLNTVMARDAYYAHDLDVRLARLAQIEQALAEQLELAASPAVLDAAARELGMVIAPQPAFIRLVDGVIIGSPTAATAED